LKRCPNRSHRRLARHAESPSQLRLPQDHAAPVNGSPPRSGNPGSQGLTGTLGADVALRFEQAADINVVYAKVRGLLGG
jgi:hypothetical protein